MEPDLNPFFILIPMLIAWVIFIAIIVLIEVSFARSRKRRLSAEPSPAPFSSPADPAKWAKGFLIACLVLTLIDVISGILQLELFSRIARGYGFTLDEAVRSDLRQTLLALFWALAFYGTAVPFLIWFHRVHKNLRSLGNRGLIFTPGWAVGFFFVPLLNLVRPFQAMREAWHGSDPGHMGLDVASQGSKFGRRLGTPSLVGWWWALLLVPGPIGMFGLMIRSLALIDKPDISMFQVSASLFLVRDLLLIPSALVAIRLVGRLTKWQIEKTELITQRGGLAAIELQDAPDDASPLSFERERSANPYFAVLKKYADFKGRAGRLEFWGFTLINAPLLFLLAMSDIALFYGNDAGFPFLTVLYCLAIFLPALAVQVRRLHDTGRSGWWCLIGLVPLVGALMLLVFFAEAGDPAANAYGPDPKTVTGHPPLKIRPASLLAADMLFLAGVGLAVSTYLPRFSEDRQSVLYSNDSQEEPFDESFSPTSREKIEAEATRMNTGLEAVVIRHSFEAGTYSAAVDVRNRGSKTYDWIMVRVEFLNKAGGVVATLKNDARGGLPIPPGGLRNFSVTGRGSRAYETVRASVDYSVEVSLPAADKRPTPN